MRFCNLQSCCIFAVIELWGVFIRNAGGAGTRRALEVDCIYESG